MQLFLSGAEAFGAMQKDFEKSLGGYMSSTPLPNGKINALFTDIANRALYSDLPYEETVGIFLYNNSGSDKANVSLTQIYQTLFNTDDNQADFEWAAVTAIDNQRIEKISSKREIPFNATFVVPTGRRADGILTILTAGLIGQTINILGVSVPLTGNTIATLINDVKAKFDGNATYNCSIKDDVTLYFQWKNVGVHINAITLTTSGSATATPSAFSNGFDNGVLLLPLLKKDELIGLWIKRKIKKQQPISCIDMAGGNTNVVEDDALTTVDTQPKKSTLETLEVLIEWD